MSSTILIPPPIYSSTTGDSVGKEPPQERDKRKFISFDNFFET